MHVRRLRPDEWAALRAVRLRALADAPDAFGSTLAEAEARSDAEWQAQADPSDGAVFVVDGPAGFVGLARGGPAPIDVTYAALYSMWVAPEARGQGVGMALIDAVKAWAAAAGYPGLGLGVTTTNAPAIALYRRAGFVETGDHYPLRGDTDLEIQIMALPLEPAGQTTPPAGEGPDGRGADRATGRPGRRSP